MYGMGVGKLSNQLDISKDEAKDILELYNDKVPFVKQIATIASQRATTEGQIRTILGRRCRFHLWEPRTFGYNKPLPLEEAKKQYGNVGALKSRFLNGMRQNGYEAEFAERCFSQIEGFGSYGFPESHAASFALLVYASAWIKCQPPGIFACALYALLANSNYLFFPFFASFYNV